MEIEPSNLWSDGDTYLWAKRAKERACRLSPTIERIEVSNSRRASDTTVLIGFSSSKVDANDAPATQAIRMMTREKEVRAMWVFFLSSLSLSPELLGLREVIGFYWRRFGVWLVVKMARCFYGAALSASGGYRLIWPVDVLYFRPNVGPVWLDGYEDDDRGVKKT